MAALLLLLGSAHGYLLPSPLAAPARPGPANPAQSARLAGRVGMNMFGDLMKGMTKLQAGNYDEAAVRADVERMIARKPCVVFATTTCPFCKQANKALTDMGAVYTVVNFDEDEGGMAMKAELAGILDGRTSVPAVFVGGQFVGGANDGGLGGVLTLNKSGELAPLLVAAGALSATQRI